MLIRTCCDHCQAFTEVSEVKLGQMIVCAKCDGHFVMRPQLEEAVDVFEVAGFEADVQSGGSSSPRAVWKDGKHDLRLSSPPAEDWNLEADDDDVLAGQRFSLFRPSRKQLAPFLDDEDNDGSWLLVVGLIGCGAIGAILLVALLFLSVAF